MMAITYDIHAALCERVCIGVVMYVSIVRMPV